MPITFYHHQMYQSALDITYTVNRALVADIVSHEEVGRANAYMTFNSGIGCVTAFGLGALDLTGNGSPLKFMKTDVRAIFTLGAIMVMIMAAPTLLVREEVYVPAKEQVGG